MARGFSPGEIEEPTRVRVEPRRGDRNLGTATVSIALPGLEIIHNRSRVEPRVEAPG